MGKYILKFSGTEIKKNKFYCNKSPVSVSNIDIEKVLVSNKISFGEKNSSNELGFCFQKKMGIIILKCFLESVNTLRQNLLDILLMT